MPLEWPEWSETTKAEWVGGESNPSARFLRHAGNPFRHHDQGESNPTPSPEGRPESNAAYAHLSTLGAPAFAGASCMSAEQPAEDERHGLDVPGTDHVGLVGVVVVDRDDLGLEPVSDVLHSSVSSSRSSSIMYCIASISRWARSYQYWPHMAMPTRTRARKITIGSPSCSTRRDSGWNRRSTLRS